MSTSIKSPADIGRRYREEVEPAVDLSRFSQYVNDPAGFSRDVLGSHLVTEKQIEIMESVRDNRITLVPSANSVGKTYAAADVALWFHLTRESKIVITAAPPLDNLELLLWGEIKSRLDNRPDLVKPASVRHLRIDAGPDHWLNGRAIPSSATPGKVKARFSGVHAENLLFIVDEGDGAPDAVYSGIESCMSGDGERLLILYNPRFPSGYVYDLYINGGANMISLDAFSHPNVTTGQAVIPGAVSRSRTVERIASWTRPLRDGETYRSDDPSVYKVPKFLDGCQHVKDNGEKLPALKGGQARKIVRMDFSDMVLGRYPAEGFRSLFSMETIRAAIDRRRQYDELNGGREPDGKRITSLDVAEFGDDLNVLIDRIGGYVADPITWSGVDVLVTADRAADHAIEKGSSLLVADSNGLGAGVPPQIKRRGFRRVVAYKSQEKPTRPADELGGEFGSMRDQVFWSCREWLRLDPTAMLPNDPELARQLLAHSYDKKKGKIVVLEKSEVKKAISGESPDKADALAGTFADEPPADPGVPIAMGSAKRPEQEPARPARPARKGGKGGRDRKSKRRRRKGPPRLVD